MEINSGVIRGGGLDVEIHKWLMKVSLSLIFLLSNKILIVFLPQEFSYGTNKTSINRDGWYLPTSILLKT